MANTNGLTVGLAVGIPSFIIITVVAIFWYRNQHKQKQEDLRDNEFDIGLQDDHSFNQFQEELHKHSEKTDYVQTREDRLAGDSSETSNSNSNINDGQQHSTSTISRGLQNPYQRPAITKPQSTYDFYETFIPVLPSTQQELEAHHHNQNHQNHQNHQQQSPSGTGSTSDVNESNTNIAANSTTSLVNSHKHTSSNDLDTLAKQLNNPAFFEKLPSRAATVQYQVKPRYPGNHHSGNAYSYNNSSSDLINNYMVGETHAINDHFVYEAPKVEEMDHSKQKEEATTTNNYEESSEGDVTESTVSSTPFHETHNLMH